MPDNEVVITGPVEGARKITFTYAETYVRAHMIIKTKTMKSDPLNQYSDREIPAHIEKILSGVSGKASISYIHDAWSPNRGRAKLNDVHNVSRKIRTNPTRDIPRKDSNTANAATHQPESQNKNVAMSAPVLKHFTIGLAVTLIRLVPMQKVETHVKLHMQSSENKILEEEKTPQ